MKNTTLASPIRPRESLAAALEAADAAGRIMKRHLARPKKINQATPHDIKLELDVRCQKTIERSLHARFPGISLLGEEGDAGDASASHRWVVDPIDGTVNFTYGMPHACVSIALQQARRAIKTGELVADTEFETILGVVYDPFLDEMWTAQIGGSSRLNGRAIHVSDRRKLSECIVAVGFAKYETTLNHMLPAFNQIVHKVRKVRLLGAAALSMVWVAAGRLDAYKEYGVNLWDIAAGGLIVERAGGEFWRRHLGTGHVYEILANNGRVRAQIESACQTASKS